MSEESRPRFPVSDPELGRMIAEAALEPVEAGGPIPEGQARPYQPTTDELRQWVQRVMQAKAEFALARVELVAEQARQAQVEERESDQ